MTDALASLGLMALLTSGRLNDWIAGPIVVGMLAAITLPERFLKDNRLTQFAMVTSVVLLLVQMLRLGSGTDILEAAVEFAAALQVIRVLTREGAAHDQQIILLALLHLIAGAVVGGGLAYGACFLAFLVVAPGALVLSHLRREVEGNYQQGARDRTGLPVDVPRILRSRRVVSRQLLVFTCSLSIPIFLFTALLFVLFPRVGLSLFLINPGAGTRVVGFAEEVNLGRVGTIRSDPTIVMRVFPATVPSPAPQRLGLYLAGAKFDEYDGRAWRRTQSGRQLADQVAGSFRLGFPVGQPQKNRMRIDLEPISPQVLFLPEQVLTFTLHPPDSALPDHREPGIFVDGEEIYSYEGGDGQGLRYFVQQADLMGRRPLHPVPAHRHRYLGLPPKLSDKVAALARRWAPEGLAPFEAARAIERRLRIDYTYDLSSPSGSSANPLEHFLFESKRGHCEYYSTAMAMMLRTLDIPSRNVTGFVGGTYNRFGEFYAVRQADAHSWVEALLPKRGWVRFDPTPPAGALPDAHPGAISTIREMLEALSQRWDRHVVGYDLNQQVSLWRDIVRKYRGFQPKSSSRSGATPSPKRIGLALFGVLLLGGSLYLYYRTRTKRDEDDNPPDAETVARLQAAALYQKLELVMAKRGIPRAVGIPPWRHASSIADADHPDAEEVLELTERYLTARFGGAPLDAEQQRDYLSRVRRLQSADQNHPPASAPSPLSAT